MTKQTDPMADREMFDGEARALLRNAVTLNIRHRRLCDNLGIATTAKVTPFSTDRDDIIALLVKNGRPANVADYDHPSDV